MNPVTKDALKLVASLLISGVWLVSIFSAFVTLMVTRYEKAVRRTPTSKYLIATAIINIITITMLCGLAVLFLNGELQFIS